MRKETLGKEEYKLDGRGDGNLKVLDGHNPRGTTLREALRGICLSGACVGSLRGSAGGWAGFRVIF